MDDVTPSYFKSSSINKVNFVVYAVWLLLA